MIVARAAFRYDVTLNAQNAFQAPPR